MERVNDRLGGTAAGLANRQDSDRNRRRGALGPLHGRVFDRRRFVVDESLNAQIEMHVGVSDLIDGMLRVNAYRVDEALREFERRPL